ncbi:hypothetical protein SDRG_10033 [Saprolegnia diclina VS20]|uniref:Uncharacterized protein n=1 Tax=Saprolegnia diclina (strain VS20) TaxID=1156394 RepID=T0QFB4_SAPDV|nr:hypothetical protein SDRG_10033 [Saprolegnia diclina VS20]EQC32285.1 hypothetical protein SDRG_10033 [Saprolegnia diclina VS20]|eukprot:XP_008614226.1 hypothetical protein SDRG_10033 [Saprolegnia diclina VS20]
MVALAALGTFLLAANLSSFDPTTVHPSTDVRSTIFAVRADLVGGHFASAEPAANVTFPVADAASTVYISYTSYWRAVDAAKPAPSVRQFVSALLFEAPILPYTCAPTIYGSTFSDQISKTKLLEVADPNVTVLAYMDLGSRSATQFVLSVESGCLDFATLQCNLGATYGAVDFRIGFTRAKYMELNPRSSMEHCDISKPTGRGLDMNVAFSVPTGDWARHTIADDAKAFFNYKAPEKTTPPTAAPTTSTQRPVTVAPAATSAALSLATSALTGVCVLYLVLALY